MPSLSGLLRRFAPRNDAHATHLAMTMPAVIASGAKQSSRAALSGLLHPAHFAMTMPATLSQ
ncbi:MAG: hypothetical protein LBT00_01440 [Spirochaetaceae bacterium]|nr:hypothetical protein [Spirochaetaceae bacterium]